VVGASSPSQKPDDIPFIIYCIGISAAAGSRSHDDSELSADATSVFMLPVDSTCAACEVRFAQLGKQMRDVADEYSFGRRRGCLTFDPFDEVRDQAVQKDYGRPTDCA
jgi:hypothetical protein